MCTAPRLRELPPECWELTLHDLGDVEELLDRLEREGCIRVEMAVLADRRFAVRWRR
jgi:hypothetical protein